MQANMDKLIDLKLEGDIALLLVQLDKIYKQFMTYQGKQPVIYTKLSKTLYGTLQAALLFWNNLVEFLTTREFTAKPCDSSVMNKMIDDKQCREVLFLREQLQSVCCGM